MNYFFFFPFFLQGMSSSGVKPAPTTTTDRMKLT
jgi:hypothetical protein